MEGADEEEVILLFAMPPSFFSFLMDRVTLSRRERNCVPSTPFLADPFLVDMVPITQQTRRREWIEV
jgi:hypothetical protein